MANSATAKAYPTSEQYGRWKARAEALDMSVSEFLQAMVEAGIRVDRGFEVAVQPDESVEKIRDERNYYKDETERLRDEIERLEEVAYSSERAAVEEAVQDLQMASFGPIVEHVRATAPERVNEHIDALVGESIREVDAGLDRPHYAPIDDEEAA